MLEMSTLLWVIYVIDSVDNTKLPCYTLAPTQHHSFPVETYPLYDWTTDMNISILFYYN